MFLEYSPMIIFTCDSTLGTEDGTLKKNWTTLILMIARDFIIFTTVIKKNLRSKKVN